MNEDELEELEELLYDEDDYDSYYDERWDDYKEQ